MKIFMRSRKFKILIFSFMSLSILGILFTNATPTAGPETFANLMPNSKRAYDIYKQDIDRIQQTILKSQGSNSNDEQLRYNLLRDPAVLAHKADLVSAFSTEMNSLGFETSVIRDPVDYGVPDSPEQPNRVHFVGGPSSPVSKFFAMGDSVNSAAQQLNVPFYIDPSLMIDNNAAAVADGRVIGIHPNSILDLRTDRQSEFTETIQHEANHTAMYATANAGQACVTCANIYRSGLEIPILTPDEYKNAYGTGFSADEVSAGRLNVEHLYKYNGDPNQLNYRAKGLVFLSSNTLIYADSLIKAAATLTRENISSTNYGRPGTNIVTDRGLLKLPHVNPSASIETIRNEVRLAGERLRGVSKAALDSARAAANVLNEDNPGLGQDIRTMINDLYASHPGLEATTQYGYSALSDQYRGLANTAYKLAVENPSALPSNLLRVPVPSQTNPIGTLRSILGFDPESIKQQKQQEAKNAANATNTQPSPGNYPARSELFARGASLTERSSKPENAPTPEEKSTYANDVTNHKNSGGQGSESLQQISGGLAAKTTAIRSVINSSSGVPGVIPSGNAPVGGAGFNQPMSLTGVGIASVQNNGSPLPVGQVNTSIDNFNKAIEDYRPQDVGFSDSIKDKYIGIAVAGTFDVNGPLPLTNNFDVAYVLQSPDGSYYELPVTYYDSNYGLTILDNPYYVEGFGNLTNGTMVNNNYDYQQGVQLGNANFSLSGNDGGFMISFGFSVGGH